jgi:hypothetical protein
MHLLQGVRGYYARKGEILFCWLVSSGTPVVDNWRKTSLSTGRLAVEEIFSFLALTPCGIFQSPSSTGVRRFPLRFFLEKDKFYFS